MGKLFGLAVVEVRRQLLLSRCILDHFHYRRHRHIANQSAVLHYELSRLFSVPVVHGSWHRRELCDHARYGSVAKFVRIGEFSALDRVRSWRMNDFKGRHFGGEIVLWAVRW